MDQAGSRKRPYALKAGEGWTYRFGIDFTVKAGEVQEGSGATFMEYVTRKGEEPPDHTHATEDEIFYVLDGAVTFRCGEETFDLEKGGFILLPRGIEHGYTLRSDGPVRLIVVTAPVREKSSGGWGGFVADMERGQGELIARPMMPVEAEELGLP
jgi:quercetin dioxygenase-like cupin family protein